MGILCKCLSTIKDFKSESKVLNICRMVVVSICACLLVVGACNYKVLADEGKSTAVAKPIGVELDSTKENELWVGDIVWWEHSMWQEPTEGIYFYEIEIVDGNSIEIYESRTESTLHRLGIHCVKIGKSTIRVKYVDESGLEGTVTYIINVVKGEDVVLSETNMSLLVGETISVKAENMRYGAVPCISGINSKDEDKFYHMDWFGDIGTFSRDGVKMMCGIWGAVLPGEIPYEYHNMMTEDVYATGTITIEEPIIETNAPQAIGVGSNLILETDLTNISRSWLTEDVFKPEITIIEGNDCVNLTSIEHTTFATKDNLEFVKAGTVKLSVKYVGDATALMGMVNEVCSAEKIITITVADKNVEIIEDIEKEDVTIITRETLLDSYKKNNLVSVNVIEEGDLLYSWQFAPKDMNTIVNVDLRVDMGVQDKKVAEIASQFDPYAIKFFHHGKLPDNTKVKMSVPEKFYDVKAYVYHLEEDGTATLIYEGMVKDGYIDIPLEHCSTYFVTKEKLKENSTEVSTKETTTKETTTKDTTAKQTTDNKETTKREEETTIAEQKTDKVTIESDSANNETTTTDMKENETTTTNSKEDDTTTTDVKETDTIKLQDEVREKETPKKGNGGTIVAVIICVAVIIGVGGTTLYLYLKKHK